MKKIKKIKKAAGPDEGAGLDEGYLFYTGSSTPAHLHRLPLLLVKVAGVDEPV